MADSTVENGSEGTPRVPPRHIDDWDDEVDQALSLLSAQGHAQAPGPANRSTSHILGIYAWHPALIRGWMPFSAHLRNSTLTDRDRELAIVRTTWLGHGEYEWSQHVRMSEASGTLTRDDVDALGVGPDSEHWTDGERDLVRAVDEMVTAKRVTDETWARLEGLFDRQQLIDLVFTVGTYDMHSMAFATLGLTLEPGMEEFPAEHGREAS